MKSGQRKNEHILGLDLVRFAAAAMVMTFHYDLASASLPASWTGWVGVEVFFVLSGFVISYSAATATPAGFFRSRFVRLMPSVWLCGTATLLAFLIFDPIPDIWRRYLNTVVLWPSGPWIDGAYWTLPVEITFYAIAWLTLWSSRRLPLELTLKALSMAGALYWLVRTALQFYPKLQPFVWIINSLPRDGISFAMLGFGSYFALGGLLYCSWRDGITFWRLLFIAGSIGAGAIQIIFTASFWAPHHGHKLLPVFIWLVLTAFIFLSAWANDAITWRVGRLKGPIRLVGLSTYPLYLLHDDIGTFVMHRLDASMWLTMLVMISVALLVAAFIEPMMQKWVNRLLIMGFAGIRVRKREVAISTAVVNPTDRLV